MRGPCLSRPGGTALDPKLRELQAGLPAGWEAARGTWVGGGGVKVALGNLPYHHWLWDRVGLGRVGGVGWRAVLPLGRLRRRLLPPVLPDMRSEMKPEKSDVVQRHFGFFFCLLGSLTLQEQVGKSGKRECTCSCLLLHMFVVCIHGVGHGIAFSPSLNLS